MLMLGNSNGGGWNGFGLAPSIRYRVGFLFSWPCSHVGQISCTFFKIFYWIVKKIIEDLFKKTILS